MIYFHWIAGTVLALIWLSRVVDTALGVRTLTNISQPEWDRHPATPAGNPRVAIIVPARNEEASIEQALTQLLALDYDNYEVIAVNDRSSDRTGETMDRVAAKFEPMTCSDGRPRPCRLRVIHIEDLPAGWMGKAHAMWTAANSAPDADWLLFTDADVMFRPDCIRRAIAYAEQERADHVVLSPRILMDRVGEKMMVSFFQLLFVFGHRPWKVADPKAKDHMGIGAFNLVRRSAYEAVGTYRALRFEVVDDMKLGKVIKNAGFRQRCVIGRAMRGKDLVEIRWATGARGVVHNLTKNFFAVMSFQWWRAIGFCILAAIVNILPFAGVLAAHGAARVPYAIALACIFFLYAGMSLSSGVGPWYFFLHPLGTFLIIYTTLRSMIFTLWRGGVEWRGTFYPLDQLKKGLV